MSSKSRKQKLRRSERPARTPDPLKALRSEFDALVARMNTPRAEQASRALFDASGKELGAFAQAHAIATENAKRRGLIGPKVIEDIIASDPQARRHYYDTKVSISVAQHIRDLRKRAGFSQRELAGKLGVSEQRIAEFESRRGSVSRVTISFLMRVAVACNCEILIVAKPLPRSSEAKEDLS